MPHNGQPKTMLSYDPEQSLLTRISELEAYNRQIDRLEEVRLLQLQHAKKKLLRKRSSDEVSVLSFACTASCTSTAQAQAQSPTDTRASNRSDASADAAAAAKMLAKRFELQKVSSSLETKADHTKRVTQELADSWQARLDATLENRHEQLEQLQQLQQHSTVVQEKLRQTKGSVEQATALAAAATKRRLRDAARARVQSALNEELRAEAAAEQLRRSTQRQVQAAQRFQALKSDAGSRGSPSPVHDSDGSVASSPMQKVIDNGSAARKVDAEEYKTEFREWAAELEDRAEAYFGSELEMASSVASKEADTVQSLHLSLREKEEELGRAMKEHLHMASQEIHERAKQKVDLARKKCQVELKKLRAEQASEELAAAAREQGEKELDKKLSNAEGILQRAAAKEREEVWVMKEAGEAECARIAAQFEEDTARQLGNLQTSHRQQEEMLAKREEQSSIAQSAATVKAWHQRLEDAEVATAAARAQLREASEMQEKLWLQSSERVQELLDESSKLEEETRILSADLGADGSDGMESDIRGEEASIFIKNTRGGVTSPVRPMGSDARVQALSATTSFISDGGHPSGVETELPLVYSAALAGIEAHGWSAVYPADDPPAWTILHWAAMEGRSDVCRRLLAAGADPLCEDERGWTPVVCAGEAGETEVLSLLTSFTQSRSTCKVEKESPIPPIIAASVEAVENYGWQAMHGGRNDWTALHWAAAEGRHVLCARLLKENADPTQVDDTGKSALDYAREAGQQSTWLLLWQNHQERHSKNKASLSSQSTVREVGHSYGSYPQSLLLPSK